jgi:prepilin-type N-terminal cleavage/methylation domain-containing protein
MVRRPRARTRLRRGFTIVEILIAVTVLVVGVLGFVGTTAAVTRMLSRGNRSNRGAFISQQRLEQIQATPCQLLANGSETRANIYQLSWTVTTTPGGNGKNVRLITGYPAVLSRPRADTMETTVLCIR